MEAILGYARFQEFCRNNDGMADYYFKMAVKADSSNGEALSSYARFLHEKKKDYPGALKHYKMVSLLWMKMHTREETEAVKRCKMVGGCVFR